MPEKIIITHAFGPDNRGDHELLQKLIDIVYDKYGREVSISVFTSFPDKSAEVFSNKDIKFLKSPISLAGKKKSFVEYCKLTLSLFGYFIFYLTNTTLFLNKISTNKIKIIREANYIFYCPGGYLYSNGRSYFANIFNGLLLGKSEANIFFSPMSIGPFYSSFDHELCKKLLKTSYKIFARESFTFKLVQNMGFENVYLSTDLAWYKSDIEEFEDDFTWRNRFVITVLDWDYNDIGNQEHYKNRYFEEIIKCCKILHHDSGKKVVLYNQVGTGKGNTNDEILIRQIISKIPDYVQFDSEEIDPEQLKSRLHHSKGLIASRFHSALFAIQANLPFVSLSYQPKAEYILKDMNLSDLCRKINEFDGEEVANYLIAINRNKDSFISKLEDAKAKSNKLIFDNFYKQIE